MLPYTASDVFFESPRRLAACLSDAVDALGPDRRAVVCRELTKTHEEVRRGTLADLARKAEEAGVQSPALLIVGEVTRLHETLRWFNAAANPASKQVRLTA